MCMFTAITTHQIQFLRRTSHCFLYNNKKQKQYCQHNCYFIINYLFVQLQLVLAVGDFQVTSWVKNMKGSMRLRRAFHITFVYIIYLPGISISVFIKQQCIKGLHKNYEEKVSRFIK